MPVVVVVLTAWVLVSLLTVAAWVVVRHVVRARPHPRSSPLTWGDERPDHPAGSPRVGEAPVGRTG